MDSVIHALHTAPSSQVTYTVVTCLQKEGARMLLRQCPPDIPNSLPHVATVHVRGLITGRSLDKNNIKNACKRKLLSTLDD